MKNPSAQPRRLVPITVRLPRHVYDATWRTARREGQTIAAMIRALLAPYIREELCEEKRGKSASI